MAAHLFGVAEVAEAPQQTEAPPETPLDLRLKGIVYTDVAADARAIIATPPVRSSPIPTVTRFPVTRGLRRFGASTSCWNATVSRKPCDSNSTSNKPKRMDRPSRRTDGMTNAAISRWRKCGGFQARFENWTLLLRFPWYDWCSKRTARTSSASRFFQGRNAAFSSGLRFSLVTSSRTSTGSRLTQRRTASKPCAKSLRQLSSTCRSSVVGVACPLASPLPSDAPNGVSRS